MNRRSRSCSRIEAVEGLLVGSKGRPLIQHLTQRMQGSLLSPRPGSEAGRLRPASHATKRTSSSPYLSTMKHQPRGRDAWDLRKERVGSATHHAVSMGSCRWQPRMPLDRRPETAPTVCTLQGAQVSQSDILGDASTSDSLSQHDDELASGSDLGWEEGISEPQTRSQSHVGPSRGSTRAMPLPHRRAFLMKAQVAGMPDTVACCGTTEEKIRKGYMCLYKSVPLVKFGGIANRAIRAAFLEAGFRETAGSDWNILWGSFVKKNNYRRLQMWQKCNHWPGTWELGRNVDRLQRRHGKISLLPKFFILPSSWEEFTQCLKQNPSHMWIRKPLASSRGRGVRVLRKPAKLSPTCNKCIVQEYIQRPLCVHGYKFDVRIYVAVTSFHPLRAYLFQDGLVRFASIKYEKGKVKQRRMHLTNVKLNKGHKRDEDQMLFDDGKWSLAQLWSHIRRERLGDPRQLWRQIRNLAALALLAAEPKMSQQVMCCAASRSCFEIFGMDILFDHRCRAKILEVNTCPSLGCSPSCIVDKAVKYPMLAQLLQLVGPVPTPQAKTESMLSERGSRSDHVRRWRDCQPAFGNTPARDLPMEVKTSEAEWRRLGNSAWQVLLPGIDGDRQIDAIYYDSHWTHQLLVHWLRYREPGSHNFMTDPAPEDSPVNPTPAETS